MSTRQHRRYSTEFKLQVVKAYLDGEGSLKALARRYEVGHTLILFWPDKHRCGALTEEDNLEEKVRDYEAKIAALERKVGQLTMELDVLKKLGPARVRREAPRRHGVRAICGALGLRSRTLNGA